jgi:hypothetical protein
MLNTVARTSSTDVTTLVVNPTHDKALYGHADFNRRIMLLRLEC